MPLLSISRILLSAGPSSGPYNQFQLPQVLHKYVSYKSKCICLSISNLASYDSCTYSCTGSWTLFLYKSLCSISKTSLLHLHHSNLLPFSFVAFLLRKPVVFTLGTEFKNLRTKHKLLIKLCLPFVSQFVACSSATFDSLFFIPRHKLKLIRHGVDTEECLQILKQNTSSVRKKNSFMYAGRLIHQKNIDLLIKSFQQHSSRHFCEFLVVGDGPALPSLNEILSVLPPIKEYNSVKFLGLLPRAKVRELMSTTQFYLSASNSDGMPISVLECLCLGMIPIISDTRPHQEIASLGFSCFIFSLDSQSDLQRLLNHVSSLSESQLEEIRSHNAVLVEKFSIKTMLTSYDKLYSQLVAD